MMDWKEPTQEKGLLVASDINSEWLLPWWWSRYKTHNHFPVCFIDLGMSCLGKTFCQQHGDVLTFSHTQSMKSPKHLQKEWEKNYGRDLWEKRQSWLKKPFALLQTPFKRTLWLDLDCEVLASLATLFEMHGEIFLAKETTAAHIKERKNGCIEKEEILYNSGVILFDHGSKVINKWVQKILQTGEEFWGDQNALSRAIYEENLKVHILHENYNWRMSQGLNIHACIIHWVGSWGKNFIRQYGGLADEMRKLSRI